MLQQQSQSWRTWGFFASLSSWTFSTHIWTHLLKENGFIAKSAFIRIIWRISLATRRDFISKDLSCKDFQVHSCFSPNCQKLFKIMALTLVEQSKTVELLHEVNRTGFGREERRRCRLSSRSWLLVERFRWKLFQKFVVFRPQTSRTASKAQRRSTCWWH